MARLKIRQDGQWETIGKDESTTPAKAVIVFDSRSNVIGESLNITSIKKIDTGYWEHSFETPPPDGWYCAKFTSDWSDWTSRNDVCNIMKNSRNVVNGTSDSCFTYTSVYNDSGQNCGRQSLRVYW